MFDRRDIDVVPSDHPLLGTTPHPVAGWVAWCRAMDRARAENDYEMMLGLALSGCSLQVDSEARTVRMTADVPQRIIRYLQLADSSGRRGEGFVAGAERDQGWSEAAQEAANCRQLIAAVARGQLCDNVFSRDKDLKFIAALMGRPEVMAELVKFFRLGHRGTELLLWNVQAVGRLPVAQRDAMAHFSFEMCRQAFERTLPPAAQALADRFQDDLVHILAGHPGGLKWLGWNSKSVLLQPGWDAWDRLARRPLPGTTLMLASVEDGAAAGREEAKLLIQLRPEPET